MNKGKVLVIDHNLLDVMKVQDSLTRAGYDVVRLTSPNGVLAKIDYERPDALLINPWMPRLDAESIVHMLTGAPEFEAMVIVALSDQDAATLQAFCVEHDLHGYFSKSMDLTTVGGFLDNFFEE